MTRTNLITLVATLGALLAVLIAGAPAAWGTADKSIVHTDGYLSISQPPEARHPCIILRSHDGTQYGLSGRVVGLLSGDHVRIEGRMAPNRCGVQGFDVTLVQTIWADDNHRTTYYDHLHDGGFREWAERNNRVHGEPEWRQYYPPGS